MTPAERAVIDAARAWAEWTLRHLDAYSDLAPAAADLYAAVCALPHRHNDEVRAGAIIEDYDGNRCTVLMVHQQSRTAFIECPDEDGVTADIINFEHITRVISNPEADRG